MILSTPVAQALADAAVHMDVLERTVRTLEHALEVKEGQLRDAMDGIRERDEMIATLQQMVTRAVEGAAE